MDILELETLAEFQQVLRNCEFLCLPLVIQVGAEWLDFSQHIKCVFQTECPLQIIKRYADVDRAEALCRYLGKDEIPYFICILPSPHASLTAADLRFKGSRVSDFRLWLHGVLKKWQHK
jgi:hypothetical protein